MSPAYCSRDNGLCVDAGRGGILVKQAGGNKPKDQNFHES